VDYERISLDGKKCHADQAVVTKTITDLNREAFAATGAQKSCDLRLLTPNCCGVELIGALSQLRHSGQMPLLGNEDANVQLQIGKKIGERIGLLEECIALRILLIEVRSQ